MKSKEITPEEEASLETTSFDDITQTKDDVTAFAKKEEDEAPSMSDPGWSDFVMSHFKKDEIDPKGNPYVHGLRRVARLLLGPVTHSIAHVVQSPRLIYPGDSDRPTLDCAVVEYTVVIENCRVEKNEASYPITYTDCADTWFGNTDPEFARYATATTSTKAEARCLRKALQLKKVSSEEMTAMPVTDEIIEEANREGKINDTQIHFMDTLCKRCDIDVVKFMATLGDYKKIKDIPFDVAANMNKKLSWYQNKKTNIPEDIKGYDKCWKQSV